MNDPRACAILNTAVFRLGNDLKRTYRPNLPRPDRDSGKICD